VYRHQGSSSWPLWVDATDLMLSTRSDDDDDDDDDELMVAENIIKTAVITQTVSVSITISVATY